MHKPEYIVSISIQQDDYTLNDVFEWIERYFPNITYNHREYRRRAVFKFTNLDLAFKFKLTWQRS